MFIRSGLTLSDRLMYLGRAMACLRSKKLSTPALNATSLREIEDLLQVAEIQKMVGFSLKQICFSYIIQK